MKLQSIRKFCRDVRGANMVEYIILVGVVAVLAIAAFKAFGTTIQTKMNKQNDVISGTVNETS
jgi:Flp pilus assembly pilin Flp